MYFGAHVSIAGGIFNAPLNAAKIGAEVFQIFTRSPRGGGSPPITPDFARLFKENCALSGIPAWYVHTPYYINFASSTPRIQHGSASAVREELERASAIGAQCVMTHLGSYGDTGHDQGLLQTVEGLAKTLKGYKGSSEFLIEISAGAGDVIGGTFENVAEIIFHPLLKKYPIGICFDTQHAFASGYDLRTPGDVAKTFEKFDSVIGLERLKVFHCNDSKIPFGGQRDRHEHIGKGQIGISGFEALFAHPKLQNLNFILETEHDLVVEDIKLLKKIREKIKQQPAT